MPAPSSADHTYPALLLEMCTQEAEKPNADPQGIDVRGLAMARAQCTRILILGGGFGGVYTAMTLEKRFRGDASVDMALVSKENYLVFQPMLPEVISGVVITYATSL